MHIRYTTVEDTPAGLPLIWHETAEGLDVYTRGDLPDDIRDELISKVATAAVDGRWFRCPHTPDALRPLPKEPPYGETTTLR